MTEFKTFSPPPVSFRDVLRYMGADADSSESVALARAALEEAEPVLKYNIGFCKLNFTISGDLCDFGEFSCHSRSLARALHGSDFVILFIGSIGHGLDRLIARYTPISLPYALALSALGSERVEALLDAFCETLSSMGDVTPRFSAGYGDLPLDVQKDIFKLLKPELGMGVYLSDSSLMSPSKSVTAFVGVKTEKH